MMEQYEKECFWSILSVYHDKCVLCCCFEQIHILFPDPSFDIFPTEETRELAVSILSDLSPDHYRGFMEPLQHCKVKYQLQPRLVDPNIA